MNNGDVIRRMTNEQLSDLLATDRFNCLKPVFDFTGKGVEKRNIYFDLLSWLGKEADESVNNVC